MLHAPTKHKLYKYYILQKLSTRKIAEKYGCSKSTIIAYLLKHEIPIRDNREATRLQVRRPYKHKISRFRLEYLYNKKKLSAYQIAKLFNCGHSVIFDRLKNYDIKRRSLSESISLRNSTRSVAIARSVTRFVKQDFSGNLEEKAYLIGFRLGDLNVSKKPYGITVVVTSWSTKPEQNILLYELFNKYGHILFAKTTYLGRTQVGVTCFLNQTFSFLLDKSDSIPNWIKRKKSYFFAFLAGYIDAEGNFHIDGVFPRLSIKTYQKNILHQAQQMLIQYDIDCPPITINIHAGYSDKRGVITRQNLWALKVNKISSLIKLYPEIWPYMRHLKRKIDLADTYFSIIERVNRSNIKQNVLN